MSGNIPQVHGGVYGKWLIDRLKHASSDYVSGSNGYDELASSKMSKRFSEEMCKV